jgi:hypothetical protein
MRCYDLMLANCHGFSFTVLVVSFSRGSVCYLDFLRREFNPARGASASLTFYADG